MGESFMWIFALLILLFGGFFGGNRGPMPDQVTQAELQAGLNNVQTQTILGSLGRFVAWAGSGSQAGATAGA